MLANGLVQIVQPLGKDMPFDSFRRLHLQIVDFYLHDISRFRFDSNSYNRYIPYHAVGSKAFI